MNEPSNEDERTIQTPGGGLIGSTIRSPISSSEESESSDRLPIGMRLAEFEVIGYVGEGGFSIVYLAWDHSLERQVALKEYMPASLASRSDGTRVLPRSERHRDTFEIGLKSFINEGKLLAQFDHPSLVKVYRFWEAHGTAYMVMPYYQGLTLKDAVRAMAQPPDEAWLRRVLDPLMAALSVIHQAQCFHRDIAPDNVMLLAESGKPLLLDFGAARRVIGDKTQALTVILKPGFAPLEQYAEDSTMRQGPWTDVYALAAVIYWAVTGKTPPTSVGRVHNDSYVPLAQSAAGKYSAGFLAAVDRALVVLPEKRTPSIEHLRQDLDAGVARREPPRAVAPEVDPEVTIIRPATIAGVAAQRPKPTEPVAAPESGSRPMLKWSGVAAAVAVMVGAGLWWISLPNAPSAGGQEVGALTPVSPAPSPPPPAVAPPPTPPSAQTVLAEIRAGRNASIELKATLLKDQNGATRLQYQASEGGYAYVLGPGSVPHELVMLHPLQGVQPSKLGTGGMLDVGLPAGAGMSTSTYYLLWARERRDLTDGGWLAGPTGWVRNLDASVAANATLPAWSGPRCTPSSRACDATYAMTEVTDMTNVTTPIQVPLTAPSARSTAPPPRAERTAPVRTGKAASTEEKPASRSGEGLSAQCRELLSRASLGDTSADLIEKMKTLRCGG